MWPILLAMLLPLIEAFIKWILGVEASGKPMSEANRKWASKVLTGMNAAQKACARMGIFADVPQD